MKLFFARHEGFITAYCLSVFLIISACCAVIVELCTLRMQTIEHLQTNQIYLEQEILVLSKLKNDLKSDSINEEHDFIQNVSFSVLSDEQNLIVTIYEPYPETIYVYCDRENKVILDYDSQLN